MPKLWPSGSNYRRFSKKKRYQCGSILLRCLYIVPFDMHEIRRLPKFLFPWILLFMTIWNSWYFCPLIRCLIVIKIATFLLLLLRTSTCVTLSTHGILSILRHTQPPACLCCLLFKFHAHHPIKRYRENIASLA